MQASLGRKGDYSVRAALFLANHHGERMKAREIAEAMDISSRYLKQILADLVQKGLLTAMAGPTGGYCLARPPEEITLLEVVEAAEGAITLDHCVLRGGPCSWEASCPIHIPWARAQNAMAEHLAATTFAELADASAQVDAGTYQLAEDTPPHRLSTPRKRRPKRRKKN